MSTNTGSAWETLENWSAVLFILAAVFLLVTATNRGIAYLVEGYSYGPTESWLGLTVLLGRLAALVGLVGLSVRLVNERPRMGTVSRAVAVLAVVFTVILLVLAALEIAGSPTELIAVFGGGTFVLSFVTYALFGGAIIRTNAYSRRIGGLLVAAAVALLVVVFGQLLISVEVIGTIVEASLFVIYLWIGYILRADSSGTTRQTRADSAV